MPGRSKGGDYGDAIGSFIVGEGSGKLNRTLKKDYDTVKDFFSFSDSGPSRKERAAKLEKENKKLLKKLKSAPPKKAAEIRHRVGTNLGYIKNLSQKRSLGEKVLVAVAKKVGQNIGGTIGGLMAMPGTIAAVSTGNAAGVVGALVSAMEYANPGGKYAEDLARWMIGEGAPAETVKKDIKDKLDQVTAPLKTLEKFINSAEKAMERLASKDEEVQQAFLDLTYFLMENRPDLMSMIMDEDGKLDDEAFADMVNGIAKGNPPQPSAPSREVSPEEMQEAVINLIANLSEHRPEVIEEVMDEDGNFDEAAFDTLADRLLGGGSEKKENVKEKKEPGKKKEAPKKKAGLRSRLIRAAYYNKELRPALHLLWK